MVLLFLSWLLVRQLPYIYNQLRLWLVLICMGDSDLVGNQEGMGVMRVNLRSVSPYNVKFLIGRRFAKACNKRGFLSFLSKWDQVAYMGHMLKSVPYFNCLPLYNLLLCFFLFFMYTQYGSWVRGSISPTRVLHELCSLIHCVIVIIIPISDSVISFLGVVYPSDPPVTWLGRVP